MDPVIFVSGALTFISLFNLGAGTILAGWLCRSEALQEILGLVGQKGAHKTMKVRRSTAPRLAMVSNYAVLIGLVDHLLIISPDPGGASRRNPEPVQTPITLFFPAHWPFVLYALALLGWACSCTSSIAAYVCPVALA